MSSYVTEEQIAPGVQEQAKSVWPIYALLTGNIISYIGDTLTLLAIPWFVLETTGSVAQAGIVGFFAVLSTVVSGALSGVLVERMGYKRTSVIGDLLSGITTLLIPLLYYTIGLDFWALLILVFAGGLFKAPAATARSTLVPNLAELAGMRLERANAFDTGALRISGLVGAPLAGLLIGIIGTSNLLWLDAASFGLSALIIGLFVPPHMPVEEQLRTERATKPAAKQSYFAELREGMVFLKDPVLLTLIIAFMITNALDRASSAVVLPAFAVENYGSAVPLGLLFAALGGMGFVGTLVFASIGHRFPRRLTFGLCFVIGGALRFWILLLPQFPIHLIWFALAGLALGPINPLIFTVIQERTPRAKLARVAGMGRALVMIGMPLGVLISGFVVTWFGVSATLIGMGAIYLLTTLSVLINPKLKEMNKKPA